MKKIKSQKWMSILLDIGYLCASGLLFGVAYNMFFVPGEIFIGGAGAIATALNIMFGVPTGLMIFLINVPLVLLFWHFYGFRFCAKAIVGIAVSSVFVDLTAALGIFQCPFANPEEQTILCALFGGIVIGIAVSLMFVRGYTTGGSDLAAFLIKVPFPKASTPRLLLIIDIVVIVFSSFFTTFLPGGKFSAELFTQETLYACYLSMLFSFLATFMFSSMLEFMNNGFDKTKVAYIFSDKYEKIADAIGKNIRRGVTILDGLGWYSKTDKKVIFCVVKKNEIFPLKSLVRSIDENAFMILSEATETIGLGFKEGIGDVSIEPKKKTNSKNKT
ncbi:MAG: YitT family protein [Clostridia bacterium]|nr:YitT family protein [Clostridia bacterium]